MKKLFMFLAVAGLATFGASCSSSDDNDGGEKKKDLVLSGKTDVKEGDAVTFTVKVGDKAEAGTDLYVAGEKVSNPYTFAKVGEFKVQAKKNGFNDSNVLTVKVSEKDIVGPGKKSLKLSVDKTAIKLGEEVVFTVKDNEDAAVEGFVLKQNGVTITSPWKPTAAGAYKVIATKDDYNNSNEVTVVVTETVVVPESNYIKINGEYIDITAKQMVVNAQKVNGQYRIFEYPGENGGEPYAIFTINLGTLTGNNYNQLSRTIVVVEQTDEENYLFPGSSANNALFGAATAYDFDVQPATQVNFAFQDLTAMAFTRTISGQAAETKLVYEIANNDAEVSFDGSLGTQLFVNEVDANGDPVPAMAGKNNSAKVRVTMSQLVKKVK